MLGKVSGDRKHTNNCEIRFTVKSPEAMSLEIRVMSPEMPSYVARNFIMPHFIMPSIPIIICRACFSSSKIIERDILLLRRACSRGALGYFLGGHVPPGTPNWHPVLKKCPLKLTPRSRKFVN